MYGFWEALYLRKDPYVIDNAWPGEDSTIIAFANESELTSSSLHHDLDIALPEATGNNGVTYALSPFPLLFCLIGRAL